MEKDNKDKKKNKIKWEIKKANYISDAVAVRVREKNRGISTDTLT